MCAPEMARSHFPTANFVVSHDGHFGLGLGWVGSTAPPDATPTVRAAFPARRNWAGRPRAVSAPRRAGQPPNPRSARAGGTYRRARVRAFLNHRRGGGGVGTRPRWLALLACGGAYWPLALEPSSMTSRRPYYCGHPHCRGGGGGGADLRDPPTQIFGKPTGQAGRQWHVWTDLSGRDPISAHAPKRIPPPREGGGGLGLWALGSSARSEEGPWSASQWGSQARRTQWDGGGGVTPTHSEIPKHPRPFPQASARPWPVHCNEHHLQK